MGHRVLWVCRPGWQGHQGRASSTANQGTVTKLVLYSGVGIVGPFLLFSVIHLTSTITPGIANVELQAQKLEQQLQRLRQCENYQRNKILTQSESHQTKISVKSNT